MVQQKWQYYEKILVKVGRNDVPGSCNSKQTTHEKLLWSI